MLNVSSLSIGPLSTPTCPYCRQRMTVLLPFFSEVENNAADLDEASIERRQRICDNIRSYNRLYSGEIISLNYLIGNRLWVEPSPKSPRYDCQYINIIIFQESLAA